MRYFSKGYEVTIFDKYEPEVLHHMEMQVIFHHMPLFLNRPDVLSDVPSML